jgi:hypothetical protein
MKENFLDVILVTAFQVVGPNIVIVCTFGLVAIYWGADGITPDGPIWRDVAFGAMSLVGVLGALAYRAFMLRTKRMEEQIKSDKDARDKQHKANQKVMIEIIEAIRSGDDKKLNITDLIS